MYMVSVIYIMNTQYMAYNSEVWEQGIYIFKLHVLLPTLVQTHGYVMQTHIQMGILENLV